MANVHGQALAEVVALCQQHFKNVQIVRHEIKADYAVLWLEIRYKHYLIRIREVKRQDGTRKYAYYLFENDTVVGAFDNAPDTRALQLKYGNTYTQHRLETIPHQHTRHKQDVLLTDELFCEGFIAWVFETT